MKGNRLLIVFLFLNALTLPAYAHHGKDFLVTSSYRTAEKGELFLLFSSEYTKSEDLRRGFEYEPGLDYGISDKWSAEFHTHHELFDRKFSSMAIGLETVYRFFSPPEDVHHEDDQEHIPVSGFSLASLFEFEKGINGSPNGMEARLIGGSDFNRISLAVNLIINKVLEQGNSFKPGYALGTKYEVLPSMALGLEVDGELDRLSSTHLTPGIYATILPKFDLRAGASIPTSSASQPYSIRTTLIYSL